jgi:hypothetical protein
VFYQIPMVVPSFWVTERRHGQGDPDHNCWIRDLKDEGVVPSTSVSLLLYKLGQMGHYTER